MFRSAATFLLLGLPLGLACSPPIPEGPAVQHLFPQVPREELKLDAEVKDCVLVTAGGERTQQVRVPESAFLELSYGMQPFYWKRLRRALAVVVEARRADGEVELLHEQLMYAHNTGGWNGWQRATLDLAELAGETVDLAIRVEVIGGQGSLLPRPHDRAEVDICIGVPVLYTRRDDREPPYRVLVIAIDTLRADQIGAYGAEPSLTPFIDELAARGTLFENAISQANWTLPSFASIFTGLYSGNHQAGTARQVPADRTSLPQAFARNGYLTMGFHQGMYMRDAFGWAAYWDAYARIRGTEEVWRVAEWMRDHEGVPAYVMYQTYDVHTPYG
ncbi:MAG: sulfatase-like hydrolase/transferase, partial [Thermoanaerobaculia bacterium]|nr:sulfatase-like hydrolase/transferase [Thermoanaerobaculia bacterium]